MAEHICDGQWRYYCKACSGLPESGEAMSGQDELRDRIAKVLYIESSEAEDGDVVWESQEDIAEEVESWDRFARAIIDEFGLTIEPHCEECDYTAIVGKWEKQ